MIRKKRIINQKTLTTIFTVFFAVLDSQNFQPLKPVSKALDQYDYPVLVTEFPQAQPLIWPSSFP